jgi:hypothetical protein
MALYPMSQLNEAGSTELEAEDTVRVWEAIVEDGLDLDAVWGLAWVHSHTGSTFWSATDDRAVESCLKFVDEQVSLEFCGVESIARYDNNDGDHERMKVTVQWGHGLEGVVQEAEEFADRSRTSFHVQPREWSNDWHGRNIQVPHRLAQVWTRCEADGCNSWGNDHQQCEICDKMVCGKCIRTVEGMTVCASCERLFVEEFEKAGGDLVQCTMCEDYFVDVVLIVIADGISWCWSCAESMAQQFQGGLIEEIVRDRQQSILEKVKEEIRNGAPA